MAQIYLITDLSSASYVCCLLAANLHKVDGCIDGLDRYGAWKRFLILQAKQHMHGSSYTKGLAHGLA